MSMTVNNVANSSLQKDFIKLSTASRISSAANDAAGLAIAEKMTEIIKGLDKGTENTATMQNLVNTAEGGLSGISDSLNRVRELSIQSLNASYTAEDRALIQFEIDQNLQGITDIAQNTEFNTLKLLDGSFQNMHTASDANGNGKNFSIASMTLQGLGMAGYDITGNFDLNKIDIAMEVVNNQRAELGAISNTFEHTMNSNDITQLNQMASKSRIADADMFKAQMDFNKDRLLVDYSVAMQKNQMDLEKNKISALL